MVGGLICEFDGKEFEAARKTARFCSDACRKAARRRTEKDEKKPARKKAAAAASNEAKSPAAKTLARVALEELEKCGRVNTPLGQLALRLAMRIDVGEDESGSAMAALSKEFRAALNAATVDSAKKADLVDELRARRDSKRRGA